MAHAGHKPSAAEKKLIDRVARITKRLPEVTQEVDGFGHTSFRVGKKSFVIIGSGESGAGASMAIKCDLVTQDSLIRSGRYQRTPYIGQHGWVTVASAGKPDWAEIEELVEDAYRRTAPRKLIKQLDG